MRQTFLFVAIASALVGVSTTALPKSATIKLAMNQITTKTSSERGGFYVVTFSVPEDVVGKRLDTVLLEFYVDATPTTDEEVEEMPTVGVYPFTEAFVEGEPKFKASVPSVRSVPMGPGQKVLADITEIVRGWIETPSSNHGLVIGSLTGPKIGNVALKNDGVSAGTTAQITFFYQNRFGQRVSSAK